MAERIRLLDNKYQIYNVKTPEIYIEKKTIINNFSHSITAFGSCFAGNISSIMNHHGMDAYWNAENNQHFSARGLREKLENIFLDKPSFGSDDIFNDDERGLNISLRHMNLAATYGQPEGYLKNTVNAVEEELRERVMKTRTFIITLGSPTYLTDNKTRKVICAANGFPQENYTIIRAKVHELVDDLQRIFSLLKVHCKQPWDAIITLSPQRYAWLPVADRLRSPDEILQQSISETTEDGIVYSNGDKAILRTAIDEFLHTSKEMNVRYFPSYDIVMDELRAVETLNNNLNDSLHVSDATAYYVCNRFFETYCSEAMKKCLQFYTQTSISLRKTGALGTPNTAYEKVKDIFSQLDEFELNLAASKISTRIKSQIKNTIKAHYNKDYYSDIHSLTNEGMTLEQPLENALFSNKDDKWISFLSEIKKHVKNNKSICLYGTGGFAEKVLKFSDLNKGDLRFCVNKGSDVGSIFFGFTVVSPEELSTREIECVIIGSYSFRNEIKDELSCILKDCVELVMYN